MTPYEELTSPQQMRADCEAAGRNLRLESRLERVARDASRPAPSILFADFPREVPKREIRISDAATRLANALQLHLD
ncbi:hypothetical protein [Nocardioides lijunqiniae]|uniref:hypothetical protein n=1 Tax=Nocardioides lijunqiniae TaxID=2760832 RepID=UPI001877EC69|nr:hypothetical protein [Nocardioides lijunqiniae]